MPLFVARSIAVIKDDVVNDVVKHLIREKGLYSQNHSCFYLFGPSRLQILNLTVFIFPFATSHCENPVIYKVQLFQHVKYNPTF